MSEKTEELLRYYTEHTLSPMFARVADELLDAGDAARAWDICKQGIRLHPSYITGYFITAKAATCIGRYAEAHDLLCQALDLQPHCIAVRRLLDALPALELRRPARKQNILLDTQLSEMDGVERTGLRGARRRGAGNLAPDISELAKAVADPDAPAAAAVDDPVTPAPPEFAITDNLVENDLERLALLLETARIPIVEEDEETTQAMDGGYDAGASLMHRPATETLAGIYLRQGKIDAAIEVYETLGRQKPDRKQEFDKKIDELRDKVAAD